MAHSQNKPCGKWWGTSESDDEISTPPKYKFGAETRKKESKFTDCSNEKTRKPINEEREGGKQKQKNNKECFNCGLLGHKEETCSSKKMDCGNRSGKKQVFNRPWRLQHLKLLGLTLETDTVEIVRAKYKELALILHPDKNSASDATQRFQEINDAYNKLISD